MSQADRPADSPKTPAEKPEGSALFDVTPDGILAALSHELRTPLNAIIGLAELMYEGAAGPLSPEQREYLGDILSSSRHLVDVVDGVLDLARSEAGTLELCPESVEVRGMVGGVLDELRSVAAGKRLTLDAHVEPDLGLVVVDPSRFRHILYTLVSTAIRFAPDEACIMVRAVAEGPEHFRLEAEGSGDVDSAVARKRRGSIVGLALTRRFVEAHGGHVETRSAPGRGSVFSAVFPRVVGGGSR